MSPCQFNEAPTISERQAGIHDGAPAKRCAPAMNTPAEEDFSVFVSQ